MKLLKFVLEFFCWFGKQNDYLYPCDEGQIGQTPFSKPHLWKTRFGFKTSWNLAMFIIFNKS